ncbi:MAG TPA: D-glycerate dehydrogenase [Nitrososphaerales archaeon]|nr:D-glycerate dehydrogenase [Nitrososphaerales archaeon]
MNSRPRVYVTRALPRKALDRISEECDAVVWQGELPPPREELLARVSDMDGIVTLLTERIDSEVMSKAPKLKVISNCAVGYDNIDVKEATKRGILVGNTPGVLTETTADFAFALLMTAARRVVEADSYVREGKWKSWGPTTLLGQDVCGATLGIIGLGRIGAAVARRARGFDMKVVYHSRHRRRDLERELGIKYAPLNKLLSSSDFISIHTPLSADTYHLIGKTQLDKMKRTSVLVNTSRGTVVDNVALAEALRRGTIFAAALDVTDPEPLPPDHPLCMLDNVVLAPHIGSASVVTRTKMGLIAAENLIAGLKRRKMPSLVNTELLKSNKSKTTKF